MHISRDACRLVAQLARTEEAAKRCMVHHDSSARGGVAQRVLDLERQLSRTQANQAEADAKFAREKKRAQAQKARAEELQKRLDAVLRDQRRLVQRVGTLRAAGGAMLLLGCCEPPKHRKPAACRAAWALPHGLAAIQVAV